MRARTHISPLLCLALGLYAGAAEAMELSFESSAGRHGQHVSIAVVSDNTTGLRAADLEILFDPDVLAATGAETTALTGDWVLAATVAHGSISISAAGASALDAGNGALASLEFEIEPDAPVGQADIFIAQARLYNAGLQTMSATTIPGTLLVLPGCAVEAALGSADPRTVLLRQFRDDVLSATAIGRRMVALFDTCSPALVRAMRKNPPLHTTVVRCLRAIVPAVHLLLNEPPCRTGS